MIKCFRGNINNLKTATHSAKNKELTRPVAPEHASLASNITTLPSNPFPSCSSTPFLRKCAAKAPVMPLPTITTSASLGSSSVDLCPFSLGDNSSSLNQYDVVGFAEGRPALPFSSSLLMVLPAPMSELGWDSELMSNERFELWQMFVVVEYQNYYESLRRQSPRDCCVSVWLWWMIRRFRFKPMLPSGSRTLSVGSSLIMLLNLMSFQLLDQEYHSHAPCSSLSAASDEMSNRE